MRAMGIRGLKINQFTRSRHDFNSFKKNPITLCRPQGCLAFVPQSPALSRASLVLFLRVSDPLST